MKFENELFNSQIMTDFTPLMQKKFIYNTINSTFFNQYEILTRVLLQKLCLE